jgi:hypothetical protein
MESALVVVVVAVLFGGMVLMLAMGYQSSEAERARQARARQAAAAGAPSIAALPGFFASADRSLAPSQPVFSEAMVNQLEHHVRLEQAVVAQFVHQPSVDNLYRRAGTSLHAR